MIDEAKLQEFRNNLSKQVFDIWINPEIKRRQAAGELKSAIFAAQIILSFDDPPIIRFNNEVKVAIRI
jgi:hypothetical protein